jgi:hypothetical protein
VNSSVSIDAPYETADQLIARVLRRAHRMMEDLGAPNDARTILNVTQSFADELGRLDPDFDRLQFLKDVTEDPS